MSNDVILVLFTCMALALVSHRLGKLTYAIMGLVIVAYVAYAYNQ